MVSYNALRGTQNAITPKKSDNKALHGWWKYWRQQGKQFVQGGSSKIKYHDWQKIFDLYSAGIFSGISFEMQSDLPSRMYEFSTTQGVPHSFQVATAKYHCNYEVNDGVPDSIQVATAKDSSNEDVDNSKNSDPFNCNIMPDVSSDEDETASIKYSPSVELYLKVWDSPSMQTAD
jgi:hypothetical protein